MRPEELKPGLRVRHVLQGRTGVVVDAPERPDSWCRVQFDHAKHVKVAVDADMLEPEVKP